MSLLKATRKLKRVGKTAIQFRITSTFEFIELECKGTWRPENLRVVWLRNHRKVKSNDTTLVIGEDLGPNGASGKAVFNPAISVSLVVTLYRDANQTDFDEKEYKYQVENEGPGGKKVLATFNCNVADFVGIPSTKQALDLNFKCVSKKVKAVKLGITLESQFIKEGGALDDDMQSTFSAISMGQESLQNYDDDDEEDEEEFPVVTPTSHRGRLNTLQEESENAVITTKANSPTTDAHKTLESSGTGISPPTKSSMENTGEHEEEVASKKPHPWLDDEAVLIDCLDQVIEREKLDRIDLIGLYFSAGWCPPCRKFLPKLVKFYHHLRQHEKSFEIVYISSDYSKQDMMKYMKEQQMPWLGISYEGNISEHMREKFSVSAVPLFTIIGRRGEMVEESAKKSVEAASGGSAILKLYNKWHEKITPEDGMEEERVTANLQKKKGLLSRVRGNKVKKDSEPQTESQSLNTSTLGSPPKTPETGRKVLDARTRPKSKGGKVVSQELLDEREERIHHLEEINRTLKQTNDELKEEMDELRQKLTQVTDELEQIKSTSKTLQAESKELIANLNMRGWLFKRGVRGPTASVWRRRYFRLDQGSKLYYYKNSSEGNPQGFIDLDKVISVQEVTASQQDKNHSTFTVQCDGRTFQLQAHDEASMRKWMEAILYMTNWRKKHAETILEDMAQP